MIGPFVLSNGFDAILVDIDRLSKIHHYIAAKTTMNAKELADLFTCHVWKLHGLPDTIVSDRGFVFIAELWRAVCHRLQINVSLSTAFHTKTDGQTENANAFLEQYLRQYINFSQKDWETWLALSEVAVNNAFITCTEMSPFFANYSQHPQVSFGPPRLVERDASHRIKLQNRQGTEFADKMKKILDTLRSNLTVARDRQEHFANTNRTPALAYKISDLVFLDI